MITDEELQELEDWGTSPNPSTTRLVVKEIRTLRTALAAKDEEIAVQRARADEAIRQSQGYLQTARDCLDQCAAKDEEIARLRSALLLARDDIIRTMKMFGAPDPDTDTTIMAIDAALKREETK